MYSERIMNSASDGAESALTHRNIDLLFSTDVPCVTHGGDNREGKGLNAFIYPFHEWKGFPFDGLFECIDNLESFSEQEILILITSLISCDSQGEALPYPIHCRGGS